MKVCVTGASGRAGRAVVADLLNHGHHVLGTDIEPRREVFPDVPLRSEIAGNDTLLSIGHAMRALGFEPRHTWRDHVSPAS